MGSYARRHSGVGEGVQAVSDIFSNLRQQRALSDFNELARLRASNAELVALLKICSRHTADKDLGSGTWSRIAQAIDNAKKGT